MKRMKQEEFFKVPAITKAESKKYSNAIKLPEKYVSPFINIKKMLRKVSK